MKINHKHVQRLLQIYGWQCKAFSKKKRKYNSYQGQVGNIAPNILNQNFKTNLFGRKTTTDVSEFRYGNQDIHHRVYLSPYMDLATDEVIAFNISDHPTVEFTLKPLIKGLNIFKQLHLSYKTIVHSDQGIQYQSLAGNKTLKHYGAIQSMSRKGTCLDNAQMESFFHIMKDEMMDRHYQTEGQLVKAMKSWIYYYNHIRIKEKLDCKSPIEYRRFQVA
ncbi:MAG: IS3 family transposase [Acetilactobacillus jinshanensis]